MRISGRAAGQKHSGRIVALKPSVIDGYEASSEVPENPLFFQVADHAAFVYGKLKQVH